MLIDTHCHLDFKDFGPDRYEVIRRAKEGGISAIINVGSSMEGTRRSVELAEQNDFIYAAAGIHPHDADSVTEEDLTSFTKSLDNKKVVAVGEIGLDYYRNLSSKENQKKLFVRLLKEAKERDLPLIIHNRDAHKDTLDILKTDIGSSIKGVMHCFSGDGVFLKKCMDMGMFISFTCNLTFKNASRLRELAKTVPMERLLLETDAPFLAPQVFRGKRNEPAYLRYLAEEVARLKGLGLDEVARITTDNAKGLFGLC
ncbi:MAG: TatD family hydrolase [Candidatus Omnitrophica bacterium]|nr:TatD family hydrolase [Candidatus Omnitrophota bacterium]MBU4590929.1 TatD family hydrolase [Candidatus Omnitrophota bacterium]